MGDGTAMSRPRLGATGPASRATAIPLDAWLPRWREVLPPALVDRSPTRLLAWTAGAGLALDVGIRGGAANLVVAVAVALVVAGLVTDGRLASPGARVLAAAALLPAAGLAVRASPWVTATNVVAIVVLVGLAVLLSRSGSVLDTTPTRLLRRSWSTAWRVLAAPTIFTPLARRVEGPAARTVGRALVAALLALPVLALVTLLLAAADPVFAGLITPDVDLGPLVDHAVLTGVCAGVVLVVLAASLVESTEGAGGGSFGLVEVVTMLGLAAAVLGLFVVSQLVALTDAGDRLVEAAGLTPAEYARSGFFQLCWATALILGFLGVVGFLARPEVLTHPAVRALAAAVPLLASGLVVVSLRRMALYDQVFGLTMLRLWVVGAAVWMGTVLVMVAARHAGLGAGRQWVLGGALATALALVVLADVAGAEAFVVRHNVARARDGAELDRAYLGTLSDDALPALVDELGAGAAWVLDCDDPNAGKTGVAALNLGAQRAEDARATACAGDGGGG